ncbi:phospholipid/glycerol acyltransferase [Parasphaerochaeta coccoides]|uniref:Phospholipid/glycerol acyltransferase n=1 Tax=Parasphaerochaeta coccoides (strain ATCC BAA-1237 / DSM 17374 / SPN1) TaxID=760011 RepID=F4GJY3_PARC1|nr:phospholipid/glycerol acyltransferase [Parasphaerochaeta coccoides]AEC01408.1 phospholipid/glycerol acyltransferase [Parasphaerochaeta coccoides DSM 17374]
MQNSVPEGKFLDVHEIATSVSPRLAKKIPRWVENIIARLIHENDLNKMWKQHEHKEPLAFLQGINKDFNLTTTFEKEERISEIVGRNPIFVANHPLGGTESLLLMEKIASYDTSVRMITRKLFMRVIPLRPFFLPVPQTKEREEIADFLDAVKEPGPIMIFPAGYCSRPLSNGILFDYEWKSTFVKFSRTSSRPIVPVYIEGQNSRRFYYVSWLRRFFGIKASLESILLVDEMFRQNGSHIVFKVGKPIDYSVFSKDLSDSEWACRIRQHVFNLSLDIDAEFSPGLPLTLLDA